MEELFARPDRLFLAASLVFGLGLAVVTPPFQVPDEHVHFYRAYSVSEGRLRLVPLRNRGVEDLPSSIEEIGTSLLAASPPFQPRRTIAPRTILAAFEVPLAPEKREPVSFPATLQYTFAAYVPQALGIGIGRLFGAPPLALLYLARLANLLLGTLAIFYAIRLLPAFRWLAVLLGLMPMTLALRASASADATVIGAAFLLTAAAAKLIWGHEPARRRDLALLAASSAVLCASKPPYLPLAFLVFLIPAARFPGGRRGSFLTVYSVLIVLAVAWSVASSQAVGIARLDTSVDPGRQIRGMLTDPLGFLGIVAADYVVHTPRYLVQFVGHLGWLDVRPPLPFLLAYLVLLLAMVFLDGDSRLKVRPWQRGIVAAVALSCLLLISASQYAVWTPLGADYVEGLQGRYYIPVAPAAVWALHTRWPAGKIPARRLGMAVMAFTLLGFAVAVGTIVERYYGV